MSWLSGFVATLRFNLFAIFLVSDLLIKPNGKIRKIPAFSVNSISSHGAGDMFIGALAARYLIGDTMENALVYAQAAAALFISKAEEERAGITQRAVIDFMENNL